MNRIRFELAPFQEPKIVLAQKFLNKPRLDIIRNEVERRGVQVVGATTMEEFEEHLKSSLAVAVFIDEFFMKSPLTWLNIRKNEYPNIYWVFVLSKANRIVSLEAERVGVYKTIEGPLSPVQYDTYVKDILSNFEFVKPTGSANAVKKEKDRSPQMQYSEPQFTPIQAPEVSMEELFGEVFGVAPAPELSRAEMLRNIKGSIRNLKNADLKKIGSKGLRLLGQEFLQELKNFTHASAVEFVSLKSHVPFGDPPQEGQVVLSTRRTIKTREPLGAESSTVVSLIWDTHSPLRMDQVIGLPVLSSRELVGVVLLIHEENKFVNTEDLYQLQMMSQDIVESYRIIDFLGRLYKDKRL